MMNKEEYYALMRGQGLTNKYVIEPLWDKYKASQSKTLISQQQDNLMRQNQNRPPVQIKPTQAQLQAQKTLQAIAAGMKSAGGFKEVKDGGDIKNPPKRHLPFSTQNQKPKTPDTTKTPPGHRNHLPNPQAPKSAAPHSHTGSPSISQSGQVNSNPSKPEDLHKSAVHTNPPVSGYVPSKTLPVAPVRKPLPGQNFISEKLFIGQQRGQGRMATHANYLQYLKNHGQQLTNPTPHLNTQIQVHQNAKGTQSLQKGESDDDYSKGYTQITADQLRAQLAGQSVPERAKNDPTGMSVPDTNISATM